MRGILSLVLVAALLPTLQGCVPVVAGGVTAGALMASDRRTSGIYIEDQNIELKAVARMNQQLAERVHINVTSFNLNVLLTGEAPTEALRAEAEQIVRSLPHVRQVYNEIVIAAPSSLSARSSDSLITTHVKTRMVQSNKFNANHVKVVTEAGTVYLMGLVTRQEADDATEIARTTSGVKRVVRVFEYLN